ncbi:lipase [Rhizoctonia solani]|nr:lipase [Rhizoctonia solani]
MRFGSFTVAVAFSLHALAAPTPVDIEQRADSSITPISAATIASYSPYVNFAAATYCSGTATWSCTACKRVPGFVPYATGGDGNGVQYWYVGWWPSGSSVVVAHEGTDPTKLYSIRPDRRQCTFRRLGLNPLPGNFKLGTSALRLPDAHASTASAVLAAVNKVIAEKEATKVTIVGHSLGGAIASLDALYLKLNLPPTIAIKGVTYGQPRVGNQEFANLMDQKITDFSRITNLEDEVPIVPGRFLGYHHFSGEKHIKSTGVWNACGGQDNTSTDCSTGAVPDIIQGNLIDHLGPYEGVWIGTCRAR